MRRATQTAGGGGVRGGFLQELKEALWHNVLANTVWALRQAAASLQSPDRNAFYAAKAGWWRTRPRAGLWIPSETAVTEALVEEIERLTRLAAVDGEAGLDRLGFGSFEQLVFAVEQPRRVKAGLGDRSKPTDIRVYLPGLNAVDLRIEAKTVLTPAEIRSEYLSDRGLKRFCDPAEPYTIEPYGGMIAYTVTRTPDEWSADIHSALVAELGAASVDARRFHAAQPEMTVCELERPAYENPDGVGGTVPAAPLSVFHLALQIRTEASSPPPKR